jgi:pimeloyl-ACP methyl ester carboxylesterase
MPAITINGARLAYAVTGSGPETVLFIHGLMLASESWEAQRDHLAASHRVVTFDLRGQGQSEHTPTGLDLDSLAQDTAALIEALDIGPCHIVGFSMGAFIALRIAARRPELVRSLLLVGPSAEAEARSNAPRYALMIGLVTLFGPRPVASRMMRILFGDTFLGAPERAAEKARWRAVVDTLPRSITRAAAASAGRGAITAELARISAPTLVLSGVEDRPVSPAHARAVADGIAGAQFEAVPETGHAVMLERPDWFNARLTHWLNEQRAHGL